MKRRILAAVLAIVGALAITTPATADSAFTASSYWNTNNTSWPAQPDSASYIAHLSSIAGSDYMRLGGLGTSNQMWALPQFTATGSEPLTTVTKACPLGGTGSLATGTTSVHVPTAAVGSPDGDGAMLLYDGAKIVSYMEWTWVSKTQHKATACGASIYYDTSNGLEGSLAESDDSRNSGHRGVPGNIASATWAEANTGLSFGHMLKCAAPSNSGTFYWPMTGSDGSSGASFAMPEGAVLRLKPGLDLSVYGFNTQETAIARTLKQYGCMIGDSTGASSSFTLKVENMAAEGKVNRWANSGVTVSSFSALTFSSGVWEIVSFGYRP